MATASDSDLKHFFVRQLRLLSREKDAEIERTSLLISNCSHKLLERRGLAVGGLGIASVKIGLGGKSLIELERPSAFHATTVFPPHALRPGDLARIDEYVSDSSAVKKSGSKSVKEPSSIDGVVYKVSDIRIILAVDSSSSPHEEIDIPERCTLVKLANTVTHDRMRRAIECLEHLMLPPEHHSAQPDTKLRLSNAGPNSLHKVLLGLSKPTDLPSGSQTALTHIFDPSLNSSQISAIRYALNASEVACIHGPPGTGKTRVLVEVIRQMVYIPGRLLLGDKETNEKDAPKPLKILVCGASNLAVDNLLERLSVSTPSPTKIPSSSSNASNIDASPTSMKPYPPITLTRLGHPARVMSSLHSKTLDSQAQTSDEAILVEDIKAELEGLLGALSGKGFRGTRDTGPKAPGRGAKTNATSKGGDVGRTGIKKGQRLRGEARRNAWQNVKDLRKEYRKREEGIVKSILSRAQVVLATCHGAGSRQLQSIEFDVVVIDEATQAMEAVCWIPILKAKKLILAGDPMQLGPTIISDGNSRHARHVTAQKSPEQSTSDARRYIAKSKSQMQLSESAAVATDDVSTSDSEPSVSDSSSSGGDGAQVIASESRSAKRKAETKTFNGSLLRPPNSLNTTLFDRLETMYGSAIKRMLDVQYRMNTKILNFPSKMLYHSRLTSHPSNASQLLCHLPGVSQTREYEDVVGPGSEVVFWDTAGTEFWERSGNDGEAISGKLSDDDGGSLCNENEAEVVKHWVHRLMAAGVRPYQIAIITPYQAQSQMLSAMLPELGLEIGTADGMQGRENEVVVLSLVRSNPEREVGFLKEKRRLNVAMTRAKRHLCVVGDSSTISRGGKYLQRWMAWLESEADVRFAGDIV